MHSAIHNRISSAINAQYAEMIQIYTSSSAVPNERPYTDIDIFSSAVIMEDYSSSSSQSSINNQSSYNNNINYGAKDIVTNYFTVDNEATFVPVTMKIYHTINTLYVSTT